MTATIKKFVCLCVMLLLCAVPAWSTEYNVSTIDALRSTISSACTGDIINLAAGTYDLTSTLSIDKSITLRGNTSSDTIIQRSSSATSKFRNINITGSAVILQNLTIQNASSDGNGAGIYNTNKVTITNCTITGNKAKASSGQDIYHGTYHALPVLNTLIWNSVSNDVINDKNGSVILTNCATPSGIGTNPVTLTSWANPVSSSVEVDGVTHTVFTIEANTELQALVGKGIKSGDRTPATDQIGKIRPNLLTIGAIEGAPVEPITISCDVDTVQVTQGYSADVAISADLADDYQSCTVSWDISPDVSGIEFSASDGVLRVGVNVPVGSYSVDIVATITSGDETYSDNKTIRVTVYPYPVIVISEDSASGTAGSMFSQALTAKATVNSADASVTPSWSISGDLPSGITFSSGTFSGIPTVSGEYTFTVKVSADVTTIDSHDITISQDKQFTISLAAATVTIFGTPSDGTVGQSY